MTGTGGGAHNPLMNPLVLSALAVAALLWGVLFTITSHTPYGLYWFSAIFIGWAFVAAGLIAWWRRPENRTGRIMVLTGFLALLPSLLATEIPILWTLGSALGNAFGVTLFYLLLSYPRGFLTSWRERAIVWMAGIGFVGIINLLSSIGYDPRVAGGCPDCPEGLNLLQVTETPPAFVEIAFLWVGVPLAALSVVLLTTTLISRWVRASRPARRILWPVYLPAVVFGVDQFQGMIVFNYFQGSIPDFTANIGPYLVVIELTVLPLVFLIGLLRMRARRARLGRFVVELGEARPPTALKDSIARALGDPSVEVGFWLPERETYVTAEGEPLDLPSEGSGRATTILQGEGRPVAAIVHDPALLEDPTLVDGVAAAARLAVENERLAATVRAQLAEVRASRQRLVEAADAERRRVERDLHDGAQQRLVKLATTVRLAQARAGPAADPQVAQLLDEAADELQAARTELRDLAQGIHPAILTDDGLRAAIASIAELSAVPVQVDVADERYPAPVEATAYFVVSEALTNVAKHSGATRASVTVSRRDDLLSVEVEDDGIGGADDHVGSGLRGLADRVAALDGNLRVDSPPGRGTRVTAEIPCG
jgi:signal transduction histidine kinase